MSRTPPVSKADGPSSRSRASRPPNRFPTPPIDGAQAAAARPQAAVKESAWTTVIEDDALANITARSVIAGFVRPGQAELLKPFGARYFAAIRGVWERRSSEVAQTVVVGLYPSWDVSDDGIAAADAFLADPELPAALRRLVIEGRAGIERSLRARQFDGGAVT